MTDVALDAFPYSGFTTTVESLFMGVPVVTRFDDRPRSRHSLTMLKDVGLDELLQTPWPVSSTERSGWPTTFHDSLICGGGSVNWFWRLPSTMPRRTRAVRRRPIVKCLLQTIRDRVQLRFGQAPVE